MNGYNYNPYAPMYQQDTMQLQDRLNQLQQMQQQYNKPMPETQVPTQNVNWIQVAGIEGAKNQIVQPGATAWMMDNNAPFFYVKSVDGMGSATFKAFRFEEIPPEATQNAQKQNVNYDNRYVTRTEFEELLAKLGEQPEKGELSNE